jgi:hypothetical protein
LLPKLWLARLFFEWNLYWWVALVLVIALVLIAEVVTRR